MRPVSLRQLLRCAGALTLLSISVPGLAADKNTQVIADAAYLRPQRLVTIHGSERLNLYCKGKGSPTVVFDSGRGDDMAVWALVHPAVAAVTQTCSYDRAGLGFSDPNLEPRTSANMVESLRRLLQAARIRPPYVLVGHSLGGMNAKLYALAHPAEVAGLVLVDPTHEDIAKRGFERDPEAEHQYARYLDLLHDCLKAKPTDFVAGSMLTRTCASPPPSSARLSDAINALQRERLTQPGYLFAWISEQENAASLSSNQVRAARRDLGDLPLIVLARQEGQNPLETELNADTAKLSRRGSVRIVQNSAHYIQLDQPREVIDGILEVVQSVRANR